MTDSGLRFLAPTVSVLMTAYNREKYIAAAIESVRHQSYTAWELIIVDDQSRDRTAEIAQRYAAADSRIRVIVNETNLGDYPNRNRAASFARGEFLKFHDSDDVMYSHCLSTMMYALNSAPTAALALSSGSYWHGGPCPMLQSPQDAYRREFLGFGMFSVGPSCALFRTDAFRRLGGFINTGASSDGVFWLRVCTTETVVLAPGNLFWYRVHAGQELQSLRAQRDYSKLSRLKWNALLSGECPLKGAELEQAKQNCCASIFKSMVSNVKAGRMSLAALEVCSLFIVDWLRYLRKPRRSLNAGSILEHDGEFVVPKERTIELQA